MVTELIDILKVLVLPLLAVVWWQLNARLSLYDDAHVKLERRIDGITSNCQMHLMTWGGIAEHLKAIDLRLERLESKLDAAQEKGRGMHG